MAVNLLGNTSLDVLARYGGSENNSLLNILGPMTSDADDIFEEPDLMQESAYYSVNDFSDLLGKEENKFAVLSLNIYSLRAKYEELSVLLQILREKGRAPDAICLQETWMSGAENLMSFNLNGYCLISQGKTASMRGGLCIYVSENFQLQSPFLPT